jgi:hypothetical protein
MSTKSHKLKFSFPIKTCYFVKLPIQKYNAWTEDEWATAKERAAELLTLSQFDLDDYGFFNEDFIGNFDQDLNKNCSG